MVKFIFNAKPKQMKYYLAFLISFLLITPVTPQTGGSEWPLFRGSADLSGRYDSELPASPKLLWSVSTGAKTQSSPVLSDGTIYFGNDKGTLTAIGNDGRVKWKFESGNAIDASPIVFEKKVIFGSDNGILRAVDTNSGKLLWSYTTDNQIAGSANVWKVGNKAGIIVGSYDYYLHCVDPETGKRRWQVETENYINGTPAILNGKIVFGGCDGMIRIVDPVTGVQKDTVDIGVYIAASPALSGDMAYFGDYDGNIYGLNIRTKKMIWHILPGENSGSIMDIPAVGFNSIVIGSEDRYLYCYNASDGKLKWKFRTNGRITSSAVITSTEVLFGSMDGNIYILRLNDGKKLWSFNTGAPVSSSPAVINGKFFIVTDDGRLLSFGEK